MDNLKIKDFLTQCFPKLWAVENASKNQRVEARAVVAHAIAVGWFMGRGSEPEAAVELADAMFADKVPDRATMVKEAAHDAL